MTITLSYAGIAETWYYSLANKILIVRLSALGDVIHTLPVLPALKQKFPKAKIGWLVSKKAKALLENHPLIDELHVFEGFQLQKLLPLIHQLKQNQYDVALDFQGLLKSSVLPLLANIPHRIGFSDAREGASCFYTHPITPSILFLDQKTAVIERYWELLQAINCPKPNTIKYPLPEFSNDLAIAVEPNTIALSLFTAWPTKNWPLVNWKKLIELIFKKTNYPILILDDQNPKHQQHLKAELGQALNNERVHVEALNIQQLAPILKQTKAVIGGDSFVLHLAGALQNPICIGLYGPTSIRRTPPPMLNAQNHLIQISPQLACQPCHKKQCQNTEKLQCLNMMTPEFVFEALQKAIG